MKEYLEKIKKHKISEYAAQSAYFTVLSIIPFALVFISLIQYVNIDKNTLIFYMEDILPVSFHSMALNIIEEIYSKTITTLSISIIFTIWSAGKGFYALVKGFHSIYEIETKTYFYYKIRSLICTVVFICALVLTLLILVLGNNINSFLSLHFGSSGFQKIVEFIVRFRKISLSVVLFVIFILFYKFVPQCKLKLKNQILGAVFVTVFWYILSYGLSVYLEVFSGFSVMYGSLTTIILFLIWVYYLMYGILIGAEINSYLKNKN